MRATSPALSRPFALTLPLAALTLLCACGPEASPDEPAPTRATGVHADEQAAPTPPSVQPSDDAISVVLNKRAGRSELGWSFAAGGLVPAEEADLTLSSTDCGSRGRWVYLEGEGLELCPIDVTVRCQDFSACFASSVEIGGSSPAMDVGGELLVRDASGVARRLVLLARTATPADWYEAADAPFEVVLREAGSPGS